MKQLSIDTPFFIVGAPRSGTTMLSVMLDRHSHITIPPETNFFSEYLPSLPKDKKPTSEQQLDTLLAFHRIADLKITKDEIKAHLQKQKFDNRSIFQALLSAWAQKNNKIRVGEKSPKHLFHIQQICDFFPETKIICIVRDGRDVVRSLINVPWAEPENPRRFWLFCHEWNESVRAYEREAATQNAHLLHLTFYEDLVLNPEQELRKICCFLGEEYEASLLQTGQQSATVPKWEEEWKGKAQKKPDPQQVHAWKNKAPAEQVRKMNFLMGNNLRKMHYKNTKVEGGTFYERVELFIIRACFHPAIRPMVLLCLKIARYIPLRSRKKT